jgi:hypothetical protein
MQRAWVWLAAGLTLFLVVMWGARPGKAQGMPVQSYGPRYSLIPILLTDKRGNFSGSDRYLVDTWEGRVWVWPNRAEQEFTPVPVRQLAARD